MSFSNLAVAAAAITALAPKDLDVNSPSSIRGVAKTVAQTIMSTYYTGTATQFVDLAFPTYYWWECGALMGAMVDYSTYTGDTSYDAIVAEALLANVGPDYDFMVPAKFSQEGNDDLGFWGFAVLAAAETNFPQPDPSKPSWLQLGENIWNSLYSRWNTTACGGGLLWQIFASNPNGLDYKNSVSNGGFFQLSARLYRDTGNSTYGDWATTTWNWLQGIGMIDSEWIVVDGAKSSTNCSSMNMVAFSYSQAIIMYGAAVMADATGDAGWAKRVENLFTAAKTRWFSPFSNSTNVMYESACELVDRCDNDMLSFKGYMSRFLFRSAQMVPSILPDVLELLQASAQGAAKSCTGGGDGGTTCGQKWWVGGYDGSTGLGQEMCALETFQGLLSVNASVPLKLGQIQVVRSRNGTAPSARGVSPPTSTSSSSASSPSAASTGSGSGFGSQAPAQDLTSANSNPTFSSGPVPAHSVSASNIKAASPAAAMSLDRRWAFWLGGLLLWLSWL